MHKHRQTIADVRDEAAARIGAELAKIDDIAAARLADHNREEETKACKDIRLELLKSALTACLPHIQAGDKEVILAVVRLGIPR